MMYGCSEITHFLVNFLEYTYYIFPSVFPNFWYSSSRTLYKGIEFVTSLHFWIEPLMLDELRNYQKL